ncbi:hypothetical protein EW145_g4396 [Phellinidium pouzarii]|uniref:Uncharacterized protein n=1 Tax=Phellinidium pouzarii TaxID=167371 RepID=A0A4S4L3T3_9AGAM|nr:hypothetical protein EW145_g4396 [Phellinidium pouzarii]
MKGAEYSKQVKSASDDSGQLEDEQDYIQLLRGKDMPNARAYSGRRVSNIVQFYHEYFEPALKQAKAFSLVYPVLSTFIAFFTFLSFIPVLCFLGTSLFILSVFIIASVTLTILAATAVITILGIALLGVLFPISLLSMCFTVLVIGTSVGVRLFALLRTQSSLHAGVVQWLHEMKAHVYVRLPRGLKLPREQPVANVASVSDTGNYDMKMCDVNEKDIMKDETHKG